MCKVRGVPGTHDVDLGLKTIDSLNFATNETITSIPVFSKPLDKHLPEANGCNSKENQILFFLMDGFAEPNQFLKKLVTTSKRARRKTRSRWSLVKVV